MNIKKKSNVCFRFLMIVGVMLLFACTNKQANNLSNSDSDSDLKTNSALTQEIFDPLENNYQLVWEDEFEGNQLDLTKWKYRGTGPRRIGYNDPKMVKVEDGKLLLMYDIQGGDSIMAGVIGTQETYMTKYGYYECRAKMQRGTGPWAAFWMQSPGISDGEDPGEYGAEIDIFEYFRNSPPNQDQITHCVHWAYGPNQKSIGARVSTLEGISEEFHTYALEWTPEKYAFYIDGLKFHEVNEGISHIDQYMILSMEIPSTLEGLKNACAPDTFMVDYVKVYKSI